MLGSFNTPEEYKASTYQKAFQIISSDVMFCRWSDMAFLAMDPPPNPLEVKYMRMRVEQNSPDASCPVEILACIDLLNRITPATKFYVAPMY